MIITVKAEKAGQTIAQTIFEVKRPDRILKRAKKAFEAFRKEHPDIPIFDEDVWVKFDKADPEQEVKGRRPKLARQKKKHAHLSTETPLGTGERPAAA